MAIGRAEENSLLKSHWLRSAAPSPHAPDSCQYSLSTAEPLLPAHPWSPFDLNVGLNLREVQAAEQSKDEGCWHALPLLTA